MQALTGASPSAFAICGLPPERSFGVVASDGAVGLALLGLRYPVRLIPILLFECLWKLMWLAIVALRKIGPEGLSALLPALADANPQVRRHVASVPYARDRGQWCAASRARPAPVRMHGCEPGGSARRCGGRTCG